MNLQKQQLLLRLFRYFKSKKGEPRFFNKRNIWLLAIAAAYILTPDEFLFDGIGKLGRRSHPGSRLHRLLSGRGLAARGQGCG